MRIDGVLLQGQINLEVVKIHILSLFLFSIRIAEDDEEGGVITTKDEVDKVYQAYKKMSWFETLDFLEYDPTEQIERMIDVQEDISNTMKGISRNVSTIATVMMISLILGLFMGLLALVSLFDFMSSVSP